MKENRMLLRSPAAAARLLAGKGKAAIKFLKKKRKIFLFLLTLPNTISNLIFYGKEENNGKTDTETKRQANGHNNLAAQRC